MTTKQITNAQYYKGAKTRTFYAGDEFYDLMSWVMDEVETVSKGQSGCHIKRKMSVTVKLLNEDCNNYKPKTLKFKNH